MLQRRECRYIISSASPDNAVGACASVVAEVEVLAASVVGTIHIRAQRRVVTVARSVARREVVQRGPRRVDTSNENVNGVRIVWVRCGGVGALRRRRAAASGRADFEADADGVVLLLLLLGAAAAGVDGRHVRIVFRAEAAVSGGRLRRQTASHPSAHRHRCLTAPVGDGARHHCFAHGGGGGDKVDGGGGVVVLISTRRRLGAGMADATCTAATTTGRCRIVIVQRRAVTLYSSSDATVGRVRRCCAARPDGANRVH